MKSLADLAGIDRVRLPLEPPCPEVPAGLDPVFLLDASTSLERSLLTAWVERCGFPNARVVDLASSRIRRYRHSSPAVGHIVGEEDSAWLIPLRVAWLPTERLGRRTVSWMDLLKVGDPRDPRPLREYLILWMYPDRVRILVGEGATAPRLRADHASDHRPLTEFVTRRAWLALDRQERAERGDRYKIPRFVSEDIASDPTFEQRAIELGADRGLSPRRALARARYYLREIAASHSPFLIDLIANLIHWVIRRGYGTIHYDRQATKQIAQLGRSHPLVYLPSHKSNLDRLSFQFMLWENDMPPNHTAGGINMNFFPVGPLVRRTGVFFIRRTFKGNELYKFVLRSYVDYLIERRFPLEWYMEGGRSRTGKLRPPRFGLLSWVVDSFKRKKADDIYLIPVSIAYDHIHEIGAYVAEVTGGTKEKESFTWALRFARNLRRRYGDIHIRFGEPVSMATELDDDDPPELNVDKLAFEVMYRISRATPFTPTALLATALLANKDEARDATAIYESARRLAAYVEQRQLPTTVPTLPTEPVEVEVVLGLMIDHRLVSSVSAGERTVYWTSPEQTLRAAYYANTVVHFFIPRALGEVALAAPDLDAFWEDVFALRDLLKYEFFFAEKPEFRESIRDELAAEVPNWEEKVSAGEGASIQLDPPVASFALLPVLDAYQVVADELVATFGTPDEKAFMTACLERGRLYRLERRVASEQSVSQALFEGALMLARNRGIWDDDNAEGGREALAAEIEAYRARITNPHPEPAPL